jgi:hypothetical protein
VSQKTDPLKPGNSNMVASPNSNGGGGTALPPTVRDPSANPGKGK